MEILAALLLLIALLELLAIICLARALEALDSAGDLRDRVAALERRDDPDPPGECPP